MAKTKVITKKQPRCIKVEITFYSDYTYSNFLLAMRDSRNPVLQDMAIKLDDADQLVPDVMRS